MSPGRHTPHQSPVNGSVLAEQNYLQIYPRSMTSTRFQKTLVLGFKETVTTMYRLIQQYQLWAWDRRAINIVLIQYPVSPIITQFCCAVVAAILAQSNTGNGSKIYFAACLALAQIERCCAVLGRDTNRAISQQICMPEMENQTYTD